VDVIASAGGPKPTIFICYASVTGNTQSYINSVAQVLSGCCSLQVVVQDLEEFEGDSWSEAMAAAALIVVATSTYGPGAPPGTAAKFISWLQNGSGEAQDTFEGGWQEGFQTQSGPDLFHVLE
jgi:sulfite reductase alpha subunit-like flavoprotein